MKRVILVLTAIAAASVGGISVGEQSKAETVTVYKDPSCGCCAKWVEYLRQRGFATKVTETAIVEDVKAKTTYRRRCARVIGLF